MKESNKEALGLVDKLSQLNSSDPTSEPKSEAWNLECLETIP